LSPISCFDGAAGAKERKMMNDLNKHEIAQTFMQIALRCLTVINKEMLGELAGPERMGAAVGKIH
jgi:hypothetical protein